MKHMTISIISMCVVIAYSVFTGIYVSGFVKDIKQELSKTDTDVITISDTAENIHRIYNDKNKVLSFILNKEHLETVEEYLIKFEAAASSGINSDIEMYKNLLEASVDDIKRQNNSII